MPIRSVPVTAARLAIAGAISGLFMVAGAAVAADKWNMATPYSDVEFQTRNVRLFAEDVKKATNGELDITVHSAGALIPGPNIKRGVQSGQVQAGEIHLSNLGSEDRIFEIDAVPFLIGDYDDALKLWKVSRPFLEARLKKQGIRVLYAVPWPFQGFFVKKDMNSLADVKGLKQRSYNTMTTKLASMMGTVPTTVQAGEIPQAFATGIIHMVNTSATTGVTSKAWEFSDRFYDANAWASKNVVFVNEAAFAKLPAASQKAVLDAAARAETRGWELSKQANNDAPKVLAQNGMKILAPSPTLQKELRAIGAALTDEWLTATGADGKALIDAYRK
jgi:TRAP-type C4-dicarboxylate transport system substrate-binding protein